MSSSIKCPKHKDETLISMYYHQAVKVQKGGNKYGFHGTLVKSDLLYCRKCKQVKNVKIKVS